MHLITFQHVNKIYGQGDGVVRALDDVSFSVEEGEFCVLLGASGAGKTTLLNILGGMDSATSGTILFDGRNVSSMTPRQLVDYRRRDVGFVFQFYNLIPNLTALENVEIAAMLCDNPIPAKQALDMVGLSQRAGNFPAQLSGGEQQRVAIARALAKNPRMLLCDEPTGALDYVTGKTVLKMLYDLGRRNHTTVLMITHNSAIARMADRILRIQSGKILSNEINSHPVKAEELVW
ncbi:MAG: ABC transporter ATP-binding protein [Lachnospiraceae bacterium]|nr:ABC transporter ATP-binding protein [Lachnospiraceae bacterium]